MRKFVLPRRVDTLVVGAGPAGSVLARHLAAAGREVLLIDKAVFPRRKPCGGGIPPKASGLFGVPIDDVSDGRVETVAIDGGWRGRLVFDAPGTNVVDRSLFDKRMADEAMAAGACFAQGVGFLSIVSRGDDGYKIATTEGLVDCGCLCACDGVFSPVAIGLGVRAPRLGFCLEGEVAMPVGLDKPARRQAIFNIASIEKGYAWAFPRSRSGVFNTGVGVAYPRFPALRKRLDTFMRTTPELSGSPLRHMCGGMIPDFEDKLDWYAKDRAFLVGDAARLVDPLTGEGIAYAARSAAFAAESIIAGGDIEGRYNALIDSELLCELRIARRAALKFRKVPCFLRKAFLSLPSARRHCELFVELLSGRISYSELRRRVKGK